MNCIINILFLFLMYFTLQVTSIPSVTISSGTFNGENLSTYNGVSYLSFKGIKFATVTERFKEASPVVDSNESFNATDFGPLCNQMNGNESVGVEDCLYLNVYTPKLDGSVPVIVYIYGGSFNVGSTNLYIPDYFMESSKVVIVTISYRLNAFGFLYFDDPNYPANLGIRDQILALEWLKKNVKNFGGDPNRVTITGQSAGGASVSILMNSVAAKGLFDGGISDSGTACALWAVQPRCTGVQRLKMLAEKLDCGAFLPNEGGSADQIVQCLRSKSPKDILETIQNFVIYERFVPFPPIKEADFVKNPVITTYPWVSDKKNEELVPWITGVNSNEGRTLIEGVPSSTLATIGLIASTPFFLPELFFYTNTASKPIEVTTRIILENAELYASHYSQFLEKIITEGNFYYPMTKCLNRNTAPSYGYYFNYISSEKQGKINGVGHSGELKYLWLAQSMLKVRLNGSQEDKEISNFLVNTWIDFAYYQSVNSSTQQWDAYDSTLDNVLIIDNKGIKMGKNPNQNEIDFWQSLNMSSQPFDKSCSLLSYIEHFFKLS